MINSITDLEIFSNQLALAGLSFPSNFKLHLTKKQYNNFIDDLHLPKNVKLTQYQTLKHKFEIIVDNG